MNDTTNDENMGEIMDEQIRQRICRLIAGIVVVDDELDEAEDRFVDQLLAEFGFSSEQRDALFPIMDAAEAADEFCKLPAVVKEKTMDLLIQAAAVDGKYAPEEKAYLHAVSEAIGWPIEQLDERIRHLIGER